MATDDREKLLSHKEVALVIVLVLPIFFFEGGPIWRHAFRIDAAVYWSYAPIPLLALALLLRRRAWSWAGFLASTTIALAVKYMITTTIAFALWSTSDPPALEKPALRPVVHTVERTEKKMLLDVPRKTIRGEVVDEAGRPLSGAWVYLRGDFDVAEESSRSAVEIQVVDHHFEPPLTVARRSQPLIFRSRAKEQGLHTVRGTAADGTPAFHYPLVPGKAPAPVRVAYATGRLELSCAVHEKKGSGAVIILDHPDFTKSAADGRFTLENVPADFQELVAVTSENNQTRASVRLYPSSE